MYPCTRADEPSPGAAPPSRKRRQEEMSFASPRDERRAVRARATLQMESGHQCERMSDEGEDAGSEDGSDDDGVVHRALDVIIKRARRDSPGDDVHVSHVSVPVQVPDGAAMTAVPQQSLQDVLRAVLPPLTARIATADAAASRLAGDARILKRAVLRLHTMRESALARAQEAEARAAALANEVVHVRGERDALARALAHAQALLRHMGGVPSTTAVMPEEDATDGGSSGSHIPRYGF